ncbi:hypothetical protein GGE65_007989 [Skermanella aerolata]|uniref:copper chaperone PCu(A)C n=1 Tax=Skermanella aerolata TaxID=393310 RepID=UPI003D21618D
MRLFLSAIAVSVTMITPMAYAAEITASALVVEQAWARATTPSAKTGATYLTVRNTGSEPDSILPMETPVAGQAVAHQTRLEGDVSRMSEFGPLSVPLGGALEMKPGGTHIMLMDLKGGAEARPAVSADHHLRESRKGQGRQTRRYGTGVRIP